MISSDVFFPHVKVEYQIHLNISMRKRMCKKGSTGKQSISKFINKYFEVSNKNRVFALIRRKPLQTRTRMSAVCVLETLALSISIIQEIENIKR